MGADLRGVEQARSTSGAATRIYEPAPAPAMPPAGLRLSFGSWVIVAVAMALVVGGLALYYVAGPKKTSTAFQTMSIERLTNAGEVRQAAISPDGKYVAYTMGDDGKRSLWVRQVATQSDIQVLKPERGVGCCPTFSPDGNYIYFVGNETAPQASWLFQVATLGGEPRRIVSAVGARVSFSPDGKRFVEIKDTTSAVTTLEVAGLDGSAPRELAERKVPDPFAEGTATWSPDGRWIASGAYSGGRCFVVVVAAEGGPLKQLGREGWLHIGRVSWLGDSSGLVVTAQQTGSGPWQIWQISYPDGQIRRITNDLTDYRDISLTADSTTLVAVQDNLQSNLWTAPPSATDRATQLSSGAGTQDGYFGLNWTPDGRILYASRASGAREVWIMNPDGSGRQQVTWGANLAFFSAPTVCDDGHTLLYASGSYVDANVWKTDLNGGKPVPLTREGVNGVPSCSPDSKWAVFNAWRGGELMLWRVPLEGGAAEQVSNFPSAYPVVSPDGKSIAFEDESSPERNFLGVMPFAGGPARRFQNSFSAPAGHPVFHWSPGGHALDYIDTRAGVSNVWRQPLSGGAPEPVTRFSFGQIFNFAWSADGKRLALARGTSTSDAVLIRNFDGSRSAAR